MLQLDGIVIHHEHFVWFAGVQTSYFAAAVGVVVDGVTGLQVVVEAEVNGVVERTHGGATERCTQVHGVSRALDDRVVATVLQPAAGSCEHDGGTIIKQMRRAEVNVVGQDCVFISWRGIGTVRAEDRAIGRLVGRRAVASLDIDVTARSRVRRGTHVKIHNTLAGSRRGQTPYSDQAAALGSRA